MAEPFKTIPGHILSSTIAVCSDKGEWTSDHADLLRRGDYAARTRVFMDGLLAEEAAQKRAAEDANRIIIMESGYNGPPAEKQRCEGPYLTYPIGWTPKSALERRDILKPLFPGVDFGHVEELANNFYEDVLVTDVSEGGYRDAPKNGRKLALPEHADAGLLVWPKLAAAVKCVKKPKKGWEVDQIVAEYILGVFREINPTFKDYTDGNVGPKSQRLLERTAKMLAKLDKETPGDVHVQPFNAGARFVGYNVKSSRGHMGALQTHMPATDLMGFCFALSDPGCFTNESLAMDFPGTERAPHADGVFDCAPCLYVDDGRFRHSSVDVGRRSRNCGSTSVVLRVAVSPE